MTDQDAAENHRKQAAALFAQGDFAAAEIFCRSAVIAAPEDARTHYNLGVVLAKRERFEEAMASCRQAIELNPAFAPAYTNFGFCLSALNLIAQARQAFAIARQLDAENPIPILNEGIAALALGDYAAGWAGFAARWQLPAYAKFKRSFNKPIWNGEDIAGKTLFVYPEQGFGDSIQMARFIPLLAARGAKIIIEAQPALEELIRGVQGAAQVISKGDAAPDFDFYCTMMDVPQALGITVDAVPAQVPYLFADAEKVNYFRDLSPRKKARRIGLCWAGRASHENDHNRSLPFAEFAPLLARNDCEWVSLQRLIPARDTATFAESTVLNWGREFADFSAAAAAIMTMDIVIAADTAIAHLAGALGKPVWVLLPFYGDWRWLINRTDSPWYPTARLFRQEKRGDWAGVMKSVAAALDQSI